MRKYQQLGKEIIQGLGGKLTSILPFIVRHVYGLI